jgi:glutamate-1-semialdehyde 2,1-aminomutase
MMTVFFTAGPVVGYKTALACDARAFAAFFGAMLDQGVNLAPSQFEAMFVSLAHTASDVARTVEAAGAAFAAAAMLMDSVKAGR